MKPLAKIIVHQLSRLDKYLNKSLYLPQSKLYALIKNGKVFVNDKRIKDVSFNLSRKDVVSIPFSSLQSLFENGKSKIDFSKFESFRIDNVNSQLNTLNKSNQMKEINSTENANSQTQSDIIFDNRNSDSLDPLDIFRPMDETSTQIYWIDLCNNQLDHETGEVISLKDLKPNINYNEKTEHSFQQFILFEDENTIIINKPYGVSTMKLQSDTNDKKSIWSEESDYLVSDLMNGSVLRGATEYISDMTGLPKKHVVLHPIHRLDKDTTGVVIIAKNPQTARIFHQSFEKRAVKKCYWSLVTSKVEPSSGSIRMPISRKLVNYTSSRGDTFQRELMVIDEAHGKSSITEYQVMKHTQNIASWLLMYPLTGRTHQLRVHSSLGLNSPIFGDFKYGPHSQIQLTSFTNVPQGDIPKMHLHSRSILLPFIVNMPISYLNQDFVNIREIYFPQLGNFENNIISKNKLALNAYAVMNHARRGAQLIEQPIVIIPILPEKIDSKLNTIPARICIRAPLPEHMKQTFSRLDYTSNIMDADRLWMNEFSKSIKKDLL